MTFADELIEFTSELGLTWGDEVDETSENYDALKAENIYKLEEVIKFLDELGI